jgi:hypothetical protein
MKKTLESFIDPANIPKKYGGQLEFNFGDMPILDPHLKTVLEWENANNDFPHGPMYWINDKGQKETGVVAAAKIKAIAVGTKDKKERKEEICVVTTTHSDLPNGHAGESEKANLIPATRPELLTVPTGYEDEDTEPPSETPSIAPSTEPTDIPPTTLSPPSQETETKSQAEAEKPLAIQNGEIIPASRPEPVSFVTATENLSMNEKSENLPPTVTLNGSAGPHSTATANALDPNLHVGEKAS